MRGHSEAEIVARRRQPRPVRAGIGRAIDAGMVRRHIGRKQAFTEYLPSIARVAAFPDTATGNRKEDAIVIARIGRNAVDAGGVVAAAEPALALRYIPQRGDKLPAFAAVIRAEQSG